MARQRYPKPARGDVKSHDFVRSGYTVAKQTAKNKREMSLLGDKE